MAKNETKMPLPKLDELFTTEEERQTANLEKVIDIPITEIEDFPNHPFRVIVNDELKEMASSIEKDGVREPALVRSIGNGKYQMISGHRRKKASEIANKNTMPCIVRDLTDEQAAIIMVDSNLQQRQKILFSERAFAYKMKLEAMTHQGKRNDLTSDQVGEKLTSVEKLSANSPDSKSQIQRYIRLTELIKPLLDMVDNEEIAFSPAVELSFLTKQEQKWLMNSIECNVATPSLSQAQEMKRLSQSGKLSEDKIEELLSQQKPNQVEKLKLDFKNLTPKMPRGMPKEKYADHIYKALDFYNKYLEKKRSMEAR